MHLLKTTLNSYYKKKKKLSTISIQASNDPNLLCLYSFVPLCVLQLGMVGGLSQLGLIISNDAIKWH